MRADHGANEAENKRNLTAGNVRVSDLEDHRVSIEWLVCRHAVSVRPAASVVLSTAAAVPVARE